MLLRFTTLNDEARSRIILQELEEPDGPRAHFRYLNAKNDPTPDVLVLGPDLNGNMGGINLHYLSPNNLRELRTVMPQILHGANLKDRYDIGSNLAPEIFNEYYRTYDPQYIKSISPDELPGWEPKPMTPQQPPRLPPVPPKVPPQATPRPVPTAPPTGVGTLPQPAVQPRPQAPIPPQAPPQPPGAPPVDKADLQTLALAYKQRMAQAAALKAQEDELATQVAAKRKLDLERQENMKDLTSPSTEDPLQVGQMESIRYYSPSLNKYITERMRI